MKPHIKDVSGGFSSSMLDAIRHPMQASRALHIEVEKGTAKKDKAKKEDTESKINNPAII